jgi:Mn2+/Fe2+ NRAMP family transporter
VFVMLLASDRELMGPLASWRFLAPVGWISTALLIVLSVVLVATGIAGI